MTAIHHFWLGASPYSAVVVSGLFPAHAVDGMTSGLAVVGGNLIEAPRPLDAVTSGLSLAYGELATVLVGAQDLVAVAASLTLTNASMVSGLAAVPYPIEGLATGLTLTNGALVLGLISTNYPAEAISATLGITSGTLV